MIRKYFQLLKNSLIVIFIYSSLNSCTLEKKSNSFVIFIDSIKKDYSARNLNKPLIIPDSTEYLHSMIAYSNSEINRLFEINGNYQMISELKEKLKNHDSLRRINYNKQFIASNHSKNKDGNKLVVYDFNDSIYVGEIKINIFTDLIYEAKLKNGKITYFKSGIVNKSIYKEDTIIIE